MPVCHPSACFSEMSLHGSCPFSNWIVCGLLLFSFENSLYNLDTGSLLGGGFVKSVAYLFIFLTESLAEQKF